MITRSPVNRRTMLKGSAAATLGVLGFPFLSKSAVPVAGISNREYSIKAIDLVKTSFAIDLKHALSLYPKTVESFLTGPDSFDDQTITAFRNSGLNVIHTTVETIKDTLKFR